MATFLHGSELNAKIESIFEKATRQIKIISPYIKLHDRIKSVLQAQKYNPALELIVVFGKNEEDLSKSIHKEDFDFLKDFPNIRIFYEKRLHAKYYANESQAILTSMNLYTYSQNNNIEFGVMTKTAGIGSLIGGDDLDSQAWDYFIKVIEQAELLYKKTPRYENANLGFSKRYVDSIVEVNTLGKQLQSKQQASSFPREKATEKVNIVEKKMGYCIRTGVEIPFNPNAPMCSQAYAQWRRYGNPDYPEKYCHFSGEPSNGQTSMNKPILKKNWKKAKEVHGF